MAAMGDWKRSLPVLFVFQGLIWFFLYHITSDKEWSWTSYQHLDSQPLPAPLHKINGLIPPKKQEEEPVATGPLPTRPAIIAPRVANADYDWLEKFRDRYDIFVYQADVPNWALAVPANKGHEAMTYLTFIIDHYDQLPPYGLFIHGHRNGWHQMEAMNVSINALQIPALQEEGYINFRCGGKNFACEAENWLHPRLNEHGLVYQGTEPYKEILYGITEIWPQMFGASEQMPDGIASYCCAQFAVTRESIRRRERDVYIRARNWILDTKLADDISGRVLEKLWAYIFTGEPIRCPTNEYCSCKHFGRNCTQAYTQ